MYKKSNTFLEKEEQEKTVVWLPKLTNFLEWFCQKFEE